MKVVRSASRDAMGQAAAEAAARMLRACLDTQTHARVVFAAAPSQSEMLAHLVATPGLDWRRVTAFHMDEYLGLPEDAPQRFGTWLRTHLFDRVPFGAVNLIDPAAPDDYAARLAEAPIDLVCCGIGENGHLAFNDPPVADFADPYSVKRVTLDALCRQQQVNDGCFPTLADVPHEAVTLTIPRLMAADAIVCTVPGAAKRAAVRAALHDPPGPACPATALRAHQNCTLFLDAESAPDD